EPQSRYLFNAAGRPSLSGRTYGTLEYNARPAFDGEGVSPLVIMGDLVVNQGAVQLTLTGGINVAGSVQVNGSSRLTYQPGAPSPANTGYTIKGDIVVNDNASFIFSPSATTAPPLQLNGARAQTIGGSAGSGAVTFGENGRLQINNPAGVTLLRPLTVQQGLVLTNGLLTTTATNLLTLSSTLSSGSSVYATFSGGSSTSFVNGPVARTALSGLAGELVFPIGKGTAYRPLTLGVASSSTSSATYVAEQVETPPVRNLTTSDPSGFDLLRISPRRFFRLQPLGTASGFAGSVTLSFGPDDFVNNPADAGLVVASRSSATDLWRNRGRSGNGPGTQVGTGAGGSFVSGSVISAPLDALSTFSEFTLGATNNTGIFASAVNPLPVQLSRFSAQRQGMAVAVSWATASEVNSAHFDVERSLNGREFVAVATVAAQGSTQPTVYLALDKTAPATTLYYRLRQVDRDGTSANSPVVVVAGSGAAAKVLLYPNPARGSINFAAETATPYRVVNQLGQPLLRGTAPAGLAQVTLDALMPGLYFLELQTATGRVVQKFEKE
ncbi:MAG TPA: T9SS type A sorting domain-containing protein, partial [Hymenobacter sp.]